MKTDAPYRIRQPRVPRTPLLVSIPHCGTALPDGLGERFASDTIRALPDTDWHLDRLYDFADDLGATTILARYSRYVVDLNRPRRSEALYPGRFETAVVPTRSFDDEAIYAEGESPDDAERVRRLDLYWQPYHDRVAHELATRKAEFGYALLFDAHSIRSFVPALHPERLPALMLGDVDGTSCDPRIGAAVLDAHRESGLTWQANRPFKGGFITRCFGAPADGVHALQLEMSQRLYMDENPPFEYGEELAARLVPTLRATLRAFLASADRLHH